MIDRNSVGNIVDIRDGFDFIGLPEENFNGSIIVKFHDSSEIEYSFVDNKMTNISFSGSDTPVDLSWGKDDNTD